ncbi:hypothetical protein FB561_1570 [Kribbella amoyensis]|uniref:Uncharacterized protein n=1 Tax=Kribbella amoyensis TaxID=996641 RepID=A0A561BNW2_9ACTN|nr:hypothetical protein [Kribbella amoyensis]TWD80492.1 hypothetical protein FB561_1570 [Kribbella amoyensis]
MADTDDDEQVADLGPDERAEGDDALGDRGAGEDSRAKEWVAQAALTDTRELAVDDEDEADAEYDRDRQRHREDLEQDSRSARERQDTRHRHDVNRAEAEVTEALRLAHSYELSRDNFRRHADAERGLAREDRSRAASLDAGAAGRDDPQANTDRADADRYRASARRETSRANYDDATADSFGADAREQRQEAAQVQVPEQPPAAEAVRNPPQPAPKARKNLKNIKQRKPKTKALRDWGIGE